MPCARIVTYSSFMFAQRSMNDTHVEQNLAGVANLVEFVESIVEFIVVVASEGSNPSLDFLYVSPSVSVSAFSLEGAMEVGSAFSLLPANSCCGLTCFNDMAASWVPTHSRVT